MTYLPNPSLSTHSACYYQCAAPLHCTGAATGGETLSTCTLFSLLTANILSAMWDFLDWENNYSPNLYWSHAGARIHLPLLSAWLHEFSWFNQTAKTSTITPFYTPACKMIPEPWPSLKIVTRLTLFQNLKSDLDIKGNFYDCKIWIWSEIVG